MLCRVTLKWETLWFISIPIYNNLSFKSCKSGFKEAHARNNKTKTSLRISCTLPLYIVFTWCNFSHLVFLIKNPEWKISFRVSIMVKRSIAPIFCFNTCFPCNQAARLSIYMHTRTHTYIHTQVIRACVEYYCYFTASVRGREKSITTTKCLFRSGFLFYF